MPKVHSHYENLKVPRDASQKVIRLAYRNLTRQYHPDRNPGDAGAERIMSMVNVAYAVISDPVKRKEHDAWIRHAESEAARAKQAESAAPPQPVRQRSFVHRARIALARGRKTVGPRGSLSRRLGLGVMGLAVCAAVAAGVTLEFGETEPAVAIGPLASAPDDLAYLRPPTAPNGQPWPAQSGYVEGYRIGNDGGDSTVTIDNSRNDNDMFVKLVLLGGSTAFPVRTFLVTAHGSFTLARLSPGNYDLRYRNLRNGDLSRSQVFVLDDLPVNSGQHPSATILSLYKGGSGDVRAFALTDAEF